MSRKLESKTNQLFDAKPLANCNERLTKNRRIYRKKSVSFPQIIFYVEYINALIHSQLRGKR